MLDQLPALPDTQDVPPEELFNPDYQSNMYLIESALRETGADKSQVLYTRSPYDAELMRLINAVPMR